MKWSHIVDLIYEYKAVMSILDIEYNECKFYRQTKHHSINRPQHVSKKIHFNRFKIVEWKINVNGDYFSFLFSKYFAWYAMNTHHCEKLCCEPKLNDRNYTSCQLKLIENGWQIKSMLRKDVCHLVWFSFSFSKWF